MDYQTRLNNILNKPGNKTCADCNGRNPRWASISLGVFVCIRCCGIHRALGTHISKMKSTTLDKWSPQMFQIFEKIDNEIANTYWEAKMPKNRDKPVESSGSYQVESFLRDKYERKLWVGTGPDPVSMAFSNEKVEKIERKEDKRNMSAGPLHADLLSDSIGNAHPIVHHHSNLSGSYQHIPSPAPSFPPASLHANNHSQSLNLFPNNAPVNFNNTPQAKPGPVQQVSNPPPVMPSFPQAGFVQSSPQTHFSQPTPQTHFSQPTPQIHFNQPPPQTHFNQPPPQTHFNQPPPQTHFNQPPPQYGQPLPQGFPANLGYPPGANANIEAEKNMKINQVLSMYSNQPTPAPQVQNNPGGGFKPLGAIAAQNFFSQSGQSYPYPTF